MCLSHSRTVFTPRWHPPQTHTCCHHPHKTPTTGLVHEVVVSRIGHFTCPVAAGALLLAQHPAVLNNNSGSSSGGSTGGSNGGGDGGSTGGARSNGDGGSTGGSSGSSAAKASSTSPAASAAAAACAKAEPSSSTAVPQQPVPQVQAVLRMKHDALVTLLDGATSFEQVEQVRVCIVTDD